VKLHKVQNREKETIYCKGAVEIYLVKVNAKVGAEAASGSGKEAKAAKRESCEITMDSNITNILEKIVTIIKDEVITKLETVEEKLTQRIDKLEQKIDTIAIKNKQIRKTDAEEIINPARNNQNKRERERERERESE